MVDAAGVIVRKDAVELTEEEWDRVLNFNLKGPFPVSKYSILRDRAGRGSIVNIASGWGLKGGPRAVSYRASRGGW